MANVVLEGTWEEVAQRLGAIGAGQKVRLTLLDERDANGQSAASDRERDPALVARVRSIRGRLARSGGGVASAELHAERQADKVREERAAQDRRR
jgi:hypothetical protein